MEQEKAAHIARFRSYFTDQVERIEAVSSALYKKLLLSALMDAISKARYPEPGNQNKSRAMKMIEDCFDWPHFNWVSMQQLGLHLVDMPETDLKRRVARACVSMQPSLVYQLGNADCPYEELAPLAQVAEVRLVKAHTHAALFYQYRNSLVHEF